MLIPGSWGENSAYINHSGKEIESSQVVLLEKKTKTFFGYNSRLRPVTLHTKLGRCGKPEPQTLELCLNQFNSIAAVRNGLKHGVLPIPPPPHCSSCPYPQKLMGSAHFCNLYSLGSDMTCVFLH